MKSFFFLFISLKSEITLLSLKNLHLQILTHVARQNKKIFRRLFQKTFDKYSFTMQFIEISSKFFSKTICEANIRKYYFNTHNTFKARGENFILKTKHFVLNQQNLLNTKSSLVCWIQSWKNFKGVWAKINSWDFLPVRNIHWNIYCQKLRNTETGSQNIALQL